LDLLAAAAHDHRLFNWSQMSCRIYSVKELKFLLLNLFEFTVEVDSDFLDFLGTLFTDCGFHLLIS
jgi:hypothetical protein